eukprot:6259586-Lingulodinium_polyedra.AAC.1
MPDSIVHTVQQKLRFLAQTFTDVSIFPATRIWDRVCPYRLYEWDGTRNSWRHADRADDGLRRLAYEWLE